VVENEAVVAAILKKYAGKVRLVPSEDVLKGFQFTQGLTEWDILVNKTKAECDEVEAKKKEGNKDATYFNKFDSYADVPEAQ